MPSLDSVPDAAIQSVVASNALLTIITAKQENLNAWSRRLKRMDLEYEEVANRRVSLLASEFSIHAWEIRQKAPTVDFEPPIIAVTDQTTREVNVYGTPKGTVVNERDRVVFRPTDSRDHVAYPFVKLPARRHNAWARVTAQLPPSITNAPSCQLVIQDPSYNVLATIRCETSTGYLLLSDQTSALRVLLFDPTRKPIVFPHRIEVALSK